MAAEIKVGVGADVKPLDKGLKEAEKSVKTFAGSVEKMDLDGKLKGSSERAGRALTDLGRVASDLPFGFVAIQNNITPLVESFGRFSSGSGSLKDTLKTLGSALVGPAGIALAFTAATSAITFFSQHPEKLDAILGTLINTTDAATAAQNAYRDSLAESTSSVQGEIANINSLLSIARNEQLSREARLEAVNKLNKEYPELNNQIKLEGINSKETTALVNKLNEALVTRAKIQAVQELIGEAFKKQVEAQNTALQSQASTMSKVGALLQLAVPLTGAFAANTSLIASGAEEQNKTLKESKKTLSEYQKILDGLNTTLAESGNLFDDLPPKVEKAFKKVKELPSLKSIGASALGNTTIATPGLDFSGFTNAIKGLKPALDQSLQDINNWNAAIVQALQQGAFNAFAGLGDAIGNAIGTGQNVFEAAGASLLASIGDTLVQMGKLTIAAGVASTALFSALSNPLNPLSGPAAIAAGVALVAIGSAVKGFAGGIGKGGKSGGGGGQNFTPSVPSGFSAQAPAGARAIPRAETIVVQGVLRGQDILLSSERTAALNFRTGGSR